MSLASRIGALFGAAATIAPDFGGVPAGVLLPYAGASSPTGWLLCYGQAVSRTTYAALFASIGTTFGTGDGSTTFNLPDMRGRVAAGKDNMGGAAASRLTAAGSAVDGATLGAVGGAESHTLTSAQMPTHSHGVNDPGHTHLFALGGGAGGGGFAGGFSTGAGNEATYGAGTGITLANAGSGGAHNNTQPTIVLNHIIKV